jgi:1-acyl-sn-glycerol-3-phosphate acyltransferase
MDLVRTVIVFVPVVISFVVLMPFGLAALLLRLLGLKRLAERATAAIAWLWARFILALTGCPFTVTGAENIPARGGFCLVANHNSIFDIVLLLASVGRPFGFIAKKELSFVPLLNLWILLLGGLFIDRKNIRKAVEAINEGIRRIKNGGAMVIFPEGTRGKGREMLPFKSGALKLATKAGAPIVPVALGGTYEVFEKDRRFRRVPVSASFAPPVSTADMPGEEKKGALTDHIYGIINGLLRDGPGADLDKPPEFPVA